MYTVDSIMQTKPTTVAPDMTLTELERLFLATGFTGFPVVREDRLIGVVSRSDINRTLITERTQAEQISDFYAFRASSEQVEEAESLEAIAARVGVRIAGLRVEDVMVRQIVTVGRGESLRALARLMFDGHIHRIPVVDSERVVGIVTSMDLVRAVAEGQLVESGAPIDPSHVIESGPS
jgi:CBS domain-containing protein